ncbi:Urea hydro-lyase [Hyphodiscus hymeniophilus]|uniref:Urea hydro-lyase n=1 Tax=Hyphodiscus hymeniophilus TaxID=353542 RepID=A0A9P6VL26_9HELO|nr:Urea hydro-lyase [Hyphodiscus hymeniophilus]
MSNPAIEEYGWTAVPVDLQTLLSQSPTASAPAKPISVSSIVLPSSELAVAVQQYAKKELPIETFNHSMRVFYYGEHAPDVGGRKRGEGWMGEPGRRQEAHRKTETDLRCAKTGKAILAHAFPTWSTPSFDETYLLTSLLHDIGTTDTNMKSTLLSFEFHGGMLALDVLSTLHAPKAQAENVAEAVIRHQDLGSVGKITRIGALVQLATIFDNMGENPALVHRETIEAVVGMFPRRGWSGCFAETIRRENGLKPWAHTTHLGEEDFPEGVKGNKLMAPWDGLY